MTVPRTVVNYDNSRFLLQRSLPFSKSKRLDFQKVLQNLHRRIGFWGTPSTARQSLKGFLSMAWFSPYLFLYDFMRASRHATTESHCQRTIQQKEGRLQNYGFVNAVLPFYERFDEILLGCLS